MTERQEWKVWLDFANIAMFGAIDEDRKHEWRYSETQLASALYEHLMKTLNDNPRSVQTALNKMRHLIEVTLTHLYAVHKDQFPRPKGLGRRKV